MFTNEPFAICTLVIIALTSVYSWVGFRNPTFRDKHLFSVPEILAGKEYHRMFTSALLHADWNHLMLNMLTLYLFGRGVEMLVGAMEFLLIYFVAILGGSALSLWIHRHHDYKAYGASGGACGMVFSFILLFPGSDIFVFPIPFGIPAWLYAILFLAGSIVALRRQADNIGHDAHLGGAIIGLWTTAALHPHTVQLQPKLFATISVLSVLLFLYLIKNPLFLPRWNFLPSWKQTRSSSEKKKSLQSETNKLDAILEKISKSGIHSLSDNEKALLNSASRKMRRQSGKE